MMQDPSLFEITSQGQKFCIRSLDIVAMVKLDASEIIKPDLASLRLDPKSTNNYLVRNYSTARRENVPRDSFALWLRSANRELLLVLDSLPRKMDSNSQVESCIWVDDSFMLQHGSHVPSDRNENSQVDVEDGDFSAVSNKISRSLVLVEAEGQNLAFDATTVLGLLPQEDMHPLVLVHSRALGCVEYQGQYLPVLSTANQDKPEQRKRILLMKAAGARFGVSISKIVDVVSDDDKYTESNMENTTQQFFTRLQDLPLEEIFVGYQNVFSKKKLKENSHDNETEGLQVYLKVSIGDTMCVPLELVEKIELRGEGEANYHLSADGEHLKLIHAKSYYFPECERKSSRTSRVLILKKEAQRVAVEVEEVIAFVYVSRASQVLYGQWLFGNLNPSFKGDVLGFVHAKAYFGAPIHSFACINFESMFLTNRGHLLQKA